MFNEIMLNASDAFIQVTVMVGAVLTLIEYFSCSANAKFIDKLRHSKKLQVVIGALLGTAPGCGASIFLMPLYVSGYVTFGTVIATLVATIGDTAFVLLAKRPVAFFEISAITFTLGVISGYTVDALRLGVLPEAFIARFRKKDLAANSEFHQCHSHDGTTVCGTSHHIGHEEGDLVDKTLHHERKYFSVDSLTYKIIHQGYLFYVALLAIGFFFAVLSLFGVKDFEGLLHLPGLNQGVFWFGVFGTAISIVYMIISRHFVSAGDLEEQEEKSFSHRESFIHAIEDTAFVGAWVFIAYFLYTLAVYFAGGGDLDHGKIIVQGILKSAGVWAVLVGALAGLIPGCGPQVIFVVLYCQGWVPFSALLANAISQDGDALIPLMALNFRSAVIATIITTIPAILIGYLAYWIETLLR